jgi:thioredoxin reductase
MTYQVVVIGAGFGGIGMAIALKQAGIDDFVVVDSQLRGVCPAGESGPSGKRLWPGRSRGPAAGRYSSQISDQAYSGVGSNWLCGQLASARSTRAW